MAVPKVPTSKAKVVVPKTPVVESESQPDEKETIEEVIAPKKIADNDIVKVKTPKGKEFNVRGSYYNKNSHKLTLA